MDGDLCVFVHVAVVNGLGKNAGGRFEEEEEEEEGEEESKGKRGRVDRQGDRCVRSPPPSISLSLSVLPGLAFLLHT